MILLPILVYQLSVVFRPFLRPMYPDIFAQADFSGYLLSMVQVCMGICGPDIYEYLWTRYLWASSTYGPGIYGYLWTRYLGTKVPRYLGNFIRIYFAIAKAVANLLIVIHVPLICSKSLLMIHQFVCRERK